MIAWIIAITWNDAMALSALLEKTAFIFSSNNLKRHRYKKLLMQGVSCFKDTT